MAPNLTLWCCPHFRQEVLAVAAGSEDLTGLGVNTHSFPCLQGAPKGRVTLAQVPLGLREGTNAVIGGGCLRGWDGAGKGLEGAAVLAPQQCFHLVAPPAMVDRLIAEGAFLMTPGWLSDWREHIAHWGFDQETARQFFQETTQKLVLLDTGVSGDSLAQLSAMGEYLGLAWQDIPVGMDMLKLSLERLVLDLRRGAISLPPPERYFADHLMVIDLLTELLTTGGEKEALGRVEELFALLFAPGRLNYTPAGSGSEEASAWAGKDFAWTRSGRGFVVRLQHRGQDLGSLELEDLAFAQYKESYLALALPLAKVCALAISNARALESRQKAEQALRNMASIVESSKDAIIGQSLQGVIVSWNQGAKLIYGYDQDEVLGRHISFLTPHDQPDVMTRKLEKIKAEEPTDQVETVWLTKDGQPLNVSLQVSPVRDEGGRIVGASSIARDITKEKQNAEQERRSLEAQLQQAQKLESVGRLAGGVAHDFNNILAIILGYCEMALQGVGPENALHHDLAQIQEAAQRAKGLTRQLLAFARKQVLQMTNLSLSDVALNFSKMIKRLIGEDIEIKMALAKDLPLVKADPSMVEQVLLNLAVNARDAMQDGGTLTIETRQVHLDQSYATARFEVVPGDYVRLAVTDTGKGMDEATRQMIFEPFFTTKDPGQGTGLGLSTVYGIVKQHGGNIWVYSEPEQGTTFTIYFPVAQVGETGIRKLAEAPPLLGGGQTILVVEDDASLRRLICSALPKLGYEVLCSGSAEEAQALARQHQGTIHIMLTDVVMPQMNGKALYESLARLRPEMKAVFMSGYTEDVIAHRGVLEEGVNFIQKPFSMKQLSHKLGSALAQGHETTGPARGGER